MTNPALQVIETMMQQQNRPHSVQTVINNTGSQFGKTTVEKALDLLVQKEKLIFEEVGKSGKLYYWNQKLLSVMTDEQIAESKEQIKENDEQILENYSKIALLKEQIFEQEQKLNDEQLTFRIQQTSEKLKEIQNQLKEYEGKPTVSEKQFEDLKKKVNKAYKTYNQRYSTVKDFISNLSEGMDIPIKQLKEEIGIDEGLGRQEIKQLFETMK